MFTNEMLGNMIQGIPFEKGKIGVFYSNALELLNDFLVRESHFLYKSIF